MQIQDIEEIKLKCPCCGQNMKDVTDTIGLVEKKILHAEKMFACKCDHQLKILIIQKK